MKRLLIALATVAMMTSFAVAQDEVEDAVVSEPVVAEEAAPAPVKKEVPKPPPLVVPKGTITMTVEYYDMPLASISQLQIAADKVFGGAVIKFTVEPN